MNIRSNLNDNKINVKEPIRCSKLIQYLFNFFLFAVGIVLGVYIRTIGRSKNSCQNEQVRLLGQIKVLNNEIKKTKNEKTNYTIKNKELLEKVGNLKEKQGEINKELIIAYDKGNQCQKTNGVYNENPLDEYYQYFDPSSQT